MAETRKPDLTYTCPACGQVAIIGTHFCKTTEGRDPLPERPGRRKGRAPGFFVLGVVIAVFLLWRWIGPGVLVVVGLGALGYWLWSAGGGSAYRELVRLCHDSEIADSLVAGERARHPHLSTAQAAQKALARYRRDLGL